MHGLHQGYSYQDLLTAFLISENLHKKDLKIGVEVRENDTDFFDDIVLVADGKKTKFQVKHSSVDTPLTSNDFTKKTSNLNLSELAKSYISADDTNYIVATNRDLTVDSFFQTHTKQKAIFLGNKTFSIKQVHRTKPFLNKFFIESSLPKASFDLSKPGSLEKELEESLRLKVGIGYYPNHQISVRDIAGRLILFANSLRTAKKPKLVDRNEVLKYINLNIEYGHIAQDFPFISSEHRLYRNRVVETVKGLIATNKFAVLQGLPGSGKSHIFDDLSKNLKTDGVLVAKHFCYLEPTDKQAQERIVVDAMYGNLIHQLGKLEPKIAEEMRPYFAATKTNLEKLVAKIAESKKKVVLMVDGLDHLNRVVAQNKLSPDLIENFIEVLLEMELPEGCTLFIASQPSVELQRIIQEKNAGSYTLEAWDQTLVEEFVKKHNDKLPTERKLDLQEDTIRQLTEKTEGNPLYLTYALKEIISVSERVDFAEYIQKLPKLNSNLNNYYQYLTKDITEIDLSIVRTLALLDFSVSRSELGEMFTPALKKAIDSTLKKINPLLKPGIVHSGLRIYHESFRRFIIEKKSQGLKDKDLYSHIINWLETKGFFESQRAYRYLIPYLIRSKEKDKTYSLLGDDFVAQGLFYFHPVESITSNLNKIADYSARKQDWQIYCKAVELRRALYTYSNERMDSVDEVYNEAVLSVHGPDLFCDRLLFDGKRVFSKTYGILLCKIAEHAGGNPPWDFYDVQGESMSTGDASSIYRFQEVETAHYLNSIRKSSVSEALKMMQKMVARNKFADTEKRQIDMLLAEFDYVFGVAKNHTSLLALKLSKNKKRILQLSVAGYLHRNGNKKDASKLADEVLKHTKDLSQILMGLMCGGKKSLVTISSDILKLTQSVLGFQKIYDDEKPLIKEWYTALAVIARTEPEKLREAKKLVKTIDGWYRAWVLYLIELSLLEASSASTAKKAELLQGAIKNLEKYHHPFKGTPRAMDLYSITDISTDSFRRTLVFAKDFPNYSEILDSISNISWRSTSYLQGSSGGPLSGETFNSLLKEIIPLLSEERKKEIKKLLEENTKGNVGTSVYYDSSAFEYLKLATVYSLRKKTPKSKEYLMDGCTRLVAYGHRKDVTLFEIVEPLQFIGAKNLTFAINAFKKTFPLVEAVWRCTDGSETKWSLMIWLNTLTDTNQKIAVQTITEMVTMDPKRDWRVEHSTERLCKRLLENNINPELIADLYETIHLSSDTRMKVTVGLKITEKLIEKGKKTRAQKVFDFISRNLYWLSIVEYVSEKENFPAMLSFARKHKVKVDEQYRDYFKAQIQKPSGPSLPPSPPSKKEKIPSFAFSGLSVSQLRKLTDENSSNYFLHTKNVKRLAEQVLKLESSHPGDVRELILSWVRNGLYRSEDIAGLITFKEFFELKGKNDIASFVSMLCFVYARGGGGWYALADSKFNYLAKDALRLSKDIAKNTLAIELSHMFSKATYFMGPTRHFMEFFSGNGQVKLAEKIWDEAYGVINKRLPISKELSDLLAKETPKLKYSQRKPIDVLIKELIDARKKITTS